MHICTSAASKGQFQQLQGRYGFCQWGVTAITYMVISPDHGCITRVVNVERKKSIELSKGKSLSSYTRENGAWGKSMDCVLSKRATRSYIYGHTSANAYVLIYV